MSGANHRFSTWKSLVLAWIRLEPKDTGPRRDLGCGLAGPGRTFWWNGDMDVAALLLDLYGRIPPLVRQAVEGLDAQALARRPAPDTNPIGWLVWHIGRVEDAQVSQIMEEEQLWATGQWARPCGLEPDPANTGYGHSADQVAAVRPEGPEVLVGYLEAVDARVRQLLAGLAPTDLDRIIDRRWDPPVTLGVRLVSIADDCLQHAGQAAYVRGLLET